MLAELSPFFIQHDTAIINPVLDAAAKEKALELAETLR
jgi:hypothetical protein